MDFPRISTTESLKSRAEKMMESTPSECGKKREYWSNGAWYGPIASERATEEDLRGFVNWILSVADKYGFPSKEIRNEDKVAFDKDVGKGLVDDFKIRPLQAIDPGIWNFMSCYLAPDIVSWRWNKASRDRWIVENRVYRHAFARTWWRSYFLKDEVDTEDPWHVFDMIDKEDIFIQVIERPKLVGYRDAVRALLKSFMVSSKNISEKQKLENLFRIAMKRLLRRGGYLDLHALDGQQLSDLSNNILDEAMMETGLKR